MLIYRLAREWPGPVVITTTTKMYRPGLCQVDRVILSDDPEERIRRVGRALERGERRILVAAKLHREDQKVHGVPLSWPAELKMDVECLRALRGRPVAYVGVIGSRRRLQHAFELLRSEGWSEEELAALHAPIGLDIGARTPAEVALSILAEITQIRRAGKRQGQTVDVELVAELARLEASGARACLATVLRTRGSVPQDVGAQMVIGPEDCLGTVGGGRGEARVIREGREVLESGEPRLITLTYNAAPHRPDADGVCGGEMLLFLGLV